MTTRTPITLGIESSNPASAGGASVALARGGPGVDLEIIQRCGLAPESRHDDALLPAIARVCESSGVKPRDLSRIAVSIGPGGYTAIRLAVTAAKVIAEVAGAECFGVPTAEAVARRASAPVDSDGVMIVAIAWKRDDVWCHEFEASDGAWSSMHAGLMSFEALRSHRAALIVTDRHVQDALEQGRPAGANAQTRFESPGFDPCAVIECSFSVERCDPVALVPLYPREPEAVRKWNELKR